MMTTIERAQLYDARRKRIDELLESVKREAQCCANGEWNRPMQDLAQAVGLIVALLDSAESAAYP